MKRREASPRSSGGSGPVRAVQLLFAGMLVGLALFVLFWEREGATDMDSIELQSSRVGAAQVTAVDLQVDAGASIDDGVRSSAAPAVGSGEVDEGSGVDAQAPQLSVVVVPAVSDAKGKARILLRGDGGVPDASTVPLFEQWVEFGAVTTWEVPEEVNFWLEATEGLGWFVGEDEDTVVGRAVAGLQEGESRSVRVVLPGLEGWAKLWGRVVVPEPLMQASPPGHIAGLDGDGVFGLFAPGAYASQDVGTDIGTGGYFGIPLPPRGSLVLYIDTGVHAPQFLVPQQLSWQRSSATEVPLKAEALLTVCVKEGGVVPEEGVIMCSARVADLVGEVGGERLYDGVFGWRPDAGESDDVVTAEGVTVVAQFRRLPLGVPLKLGVAPNGVPSWEGGVDVSALAAGERRSVTLAAD